MWRLYYQLSAEAKARYFDEIIPLLHDTKASVLGDRDHDSYYLVFLGTKPSARGRGYAKKLLEHMIQRVRFFALLICFSSGGPQPLPTLLPLSLCVLLSLYVLVWVPYRASPARVVQARARVFYEMTKEI